MTVTKPRGRPLGRPPMRTTVQADPQLAAREAPIAPVREQSSQARAKARAAQLLEVVDMEAGNDDFYFDVSQIPDGWSYEWKRHTTYNAQDPAYQVQLAQMGWEPVPAARHPLMMPVGYAGAYIERKGMILMERPEEITRRVRARDERSALDQVRMNQEKLTGAPQGQFERNNKGDSLVKIKRSYEPIPIPE